MNSALVPGAVLEETQEEKLERWMDEYGNAVLHTCFVCLRDRQMAEDAMQDTFVKAWRHSDAFQNRHEGAEKAWLLRIAINTCRDYQRSMWFKKVELPGEMEKLPPALISVAPREQELFMDVLSLPVKYRQVLLLHYYHRMTLRDMGEILGLTASSVHSRLKKAEKMLYLRLKGEEKQ